MDSGSVALIDVTRRHHWLPAASLVGALYCFIGRIFALPFEDVRMARFAAWLLSIALFVGHLLYEHFTRRGVPRQTATHVALAVAIGTVLLVLAGMAHSLLTTGVVRPVWLFALFALPVIVGLPAYVVALVASILLARALRTSSAR